MHIFLDSPAKIELTKTELDIGIVTQPYIDIAHCIRAGFCVSHALRDWVRITIGFQLFEPYSLTLDPTTIRYMGTDERSILHIVLRAQESQKQRKIKVPHGVSISKKPLRKQLLDSLGGDVLFLSPNEKSTWKEKVSQFKKLVMYCPLFEKWDRSNLDSPQTAYYDHFVPRDIAILEVVHALDTV